MHSIASMPGERWTRKSLWWMLKMDSLGHNLILHLFQERKTNVEVGSFDHLCFLPPQTSFWVTATAKKESSAKLVVLTFTLYKRDTMCSCVSCRWAGRQICFDGRTEAEYRPPRFQSRSYPSWPPPGRSCMVKQRIWEWSPLLWRSARMPKCELALNFWSDLFSLFCIHLTDIYWFK